MTTSPSATHSGSWMIPVSTRLSAVSCSAARASAHTPAHGLGTRMMTRAAVAMPASAATAISVVSHGGRASMDPTLDHAVTRDHPLTLRRGIRCQSSIR